jgi:PiT family inorganic phosphate transporter
MHAHPAAMEAFHALSAGTTLLLVLALVLALSFEFVNGFHDTANAVATVIYTRSLRPWQAVIWSGCWNLIGVLIASGAIAFGIVALLPVELVLNVGSGASFAMVFALLASAILWNLGTWYFGLPASSSHTLIGSIIGVGLANSLLGSGHVFGDGVNWGKVSDTGKALLFSPLIGFGVAAVLLVVAKLVLRNPSLYRAPEGDTPPPWIRALLILTCTGVSFAHGSNDGQKGMGLIMLILIGVLQGSFAVNPGFGGADLAKFSASSAAAQDVIERHVPLGERDAAVVVADTKRGAPIAGTDPKLVLSDYIKATGKLDGHVWSALASANLAVGQTVAGISSLEQLAPDQRRDLRSDVYLIGASIGKLQQQHAISTADGATLTSYAKQFTKITNYIPVWVKVVVALTLGLGTMIGWKRIVVTVGERIGKAHLTYAQGASAEIVAWGTIQLADGFGLPVSTTHVLSSGVAGTMAANGSGLQTATLRNIALAWLLTLPVCVFLGSAFFAFSLAVLAGLGLH